MRRVGLLILLLLMGCTTFTPYREIFPSEAKRVQVPTKTGASLVCIARHTVVETLPSQGRQNGGTCITEQRQIALLTEEGRSGATVVIPPLGDTLIYSYCRLISPQGIEIPLSQDSLIQEYRTSGVFPIPQAEVGAQIIVQVQWLQKEMLLAYEYPVVLDMPIQKGEFVYITSESVPLSVHIVGNTSRFTLHEEINKGKKIRRYSYDTLPAEQSFPADSLPRLLFSSYGSSEEGWKIVVEELKRFLGETITKAEQEKITLLLSTIEKSHPLTEEGIYRWIRDSISLVSTETHPGDVAQTILLRQGNPWDVALLLNKTLRAAGFQSQLFLTRAQNEGGFEEHCIVPAMIADPLVVVGKENPRIAFPFQKAFPLGVYPVSYWGNRAVAYDSVHLTSLPPSTLQSSIISSILHGQLGSVAPAFIQTSVYEGYHGAVVATQLLSLPPAGQEAFVQAIVAHQDRQNRGEGVQLRLQNDSVTRAEVTFVLRNEGKLFQRGTSFSYKIGHLFEPFFVESELLSQSYEEKVARSVEEEVHLRLEEGMQWDSVGVTPYELDTPLFSCRVTTEKQKDEVVIRRVTNLKAVKLTQDEIAPLKEALSTLEASRHWFIGYSQTAK